MCLRWIRWLLVFCLAMGAWQIGQVGYFQSKAWLAGMLIERAWAQTLEGAQQVRPWPWADTWPVAELTVPGLGVQQIILAGDSGRVLAFAPGYTHKSTLQDNGLSVISAHRDTHFEFLRELKNGDEIFLKTLDGVTPFQVREFAVVDARDYLIDPARFADQQSAGQLSLLLVTCYPFDALQAGGYQRFLVLAVRTPEEKIEGI